MGIRKLKQLRTYEVALSKSNLGPVAGIDEAGRGACAGPIVIAACILPDRPIPELDRLTDSKKLSPQWRERLMPIVKDKAIAWSVVTISAEAIDRWGIQHANISGMRRAVAQLEVRPSYVLIDGFPVPGLGIPSLPIIGGDAHARCVAAASVLAKQTRDELMISESQQFPEYGFEVHKGYGTKVHTDAVRRHGGSPIHRYSYANVASAHEEWLRTTGMQASVREGI